MSEIIENFESFFETQILSSGYGRNINGTYNKIVNELEFENKWFPCLYASNNLDPSPDRPTGSNGALVLCLGTGCTTPSNTLMNIDLDAYGRYEENQTVIWANSDEKSVNTRIFETSAIGIVSKFMDYYGLRIARNSSTPYIIDIDGILNPDQHPGQVMLIAHDLPIFLNYDKATIYASTGQGEPDIPPTPSEEDDSPDDWTTENADNDDLDDNAPVVNPSSSPLKCKGAINAYVLDETGVEDIMKYFWYGMIDDARTQNLLEYLTGVFGDMSQSLVGMTMYPFPIPQGQNVDVILGRFNSSLYRKELNADVSNLVYSTEFTIGRKLNNFMDYAPYTRLMIYLPFIGIRDLDTNTFMGRKIKVMYFVDYTSGGLDVYLLNGNTVVEQFTAKVGAEIPYTLDGGKSLRDIMIDSAIGGVTTTTSSLIGMAVGGGAGASVGADMMNEVLGKGTQNIGNSTHYSAFPSNGNVMNSPRNIQIWRVTPQFYIPKTVSGKVDLAKYEAFKKMYGRTNGYPYMRNEKLSNVDGYTVCLNTKIEYGYSTNEHDEVIYPNEYEKNMIKQTLESGVYL